MMKLRGWWYALKQRPHFALIFSLCALAFLSVMLGGGSAYDIQGVSLVFEKLTLWVIVVGYYQKLMAAMGDSDIEEDWIRINQGNMAVAVYRTAELVVVGVAAALLIDKI